MVDAQVGHVGSTCDMCSKQALKNTARLGGVFICFLLFQIRQLFQLVGSNQRINHFVQCRPTRQDVI